MDDSAILANPDLSSFPEEAIEQLDEQAKQDDIVASLVDHPGWSQVKEMMTEQIEWWQKGGDVDITKPNDEVGEQFKVAIKVAGSLRGILLNVEEKYAERERRKQREL